MAKTWCEYLTGCGWRGRSALWILHEWLLRRPNRYHHWNTHRVLRLHMLGKYRPLWPQQLRPSDGRVQLHGKLRWTAVREVLGRFVWRRCRGQELHRWAGACLGWNLARLEPGTWKWFEKNIWDLTITCSNS